MTGQVLRGVGFFPSFVFALAVGPVVLIAAESTGVSPQSTQAPAAVATPAPRATSMSPVASELAKAGSNGQGQLLRRVHLAVDKNLPGRVLIRLDVPGKVKSMRAKITFLQNGQIVNEVRSDDTGRFQVIGLQPGVYSVAAIAPNAAGAALVEVLPYRPNLSRDLTLLELTLDDPPPESSDPPPAPMAMPMASSPSGGGGGGGGGFGALAGLAGLAGLSGLAGLGGGTTASPHRP